VVELFLLKNVRFAKYRRFRVFVFHGHFDLIAVFFFKFEDDPPPPPPIFKCSKSNYVKKIPLHYHHLEDMGGFDFSISG
jgi:hypothetical protein